MSLQCPGVVISTLDWAVSLALGPAAVRARPLSEALHKMLLPDLLHKHVSVGLRCGF